MVTDGVYTDVYEYDESGNKLGILQPIKNINGQDFIPAKIFAQDGIRRAVYDNLCYMPDDKKIKYGVTGEILNSDVRIKNISQSGLIKNIRIVDEMEILSFNQGIGSRSRLYRTFKWNIYSRFITKLK